jgi:hypothetical protein
MVRPKVTNPYHMVNLVKQKDVKERRVKTTTTTAMVVMVHLLPVIDPLVTSRVRLAVTFSILSDLFNFINHVLWRFSCRISIATSAVFKLCSL